MFKEVETSFYPLNLEHDLSRLIESSGIDRVAREDGFNEADVHKLLLQNSRGVYNFYELLYGLLNETKAMPYSMFENCIHKNNHPIILGVGGLGDMYEATGRIYAGETWRLAYRELNIDPFNDPGHTNRYMRKITNITGNHRPILFMIPDNFTKRHPQSKKPDKVTVTYNEFLYLLKHPHRARDVLFIFGANFLDPDFSAIIEDPYERYQIYEQQIWKLMDYISGVDIKRGIP